MAFKKCHPDLLNSGYYTKLAYKIHSRAKKSSWNT